MNKTTLLITLKDLIQKTKHLPVVVEGIKDREAIRKLGYEKIFPIKGPMFSFIEFIASLGEQEIVILTDNDKKGEELYLELKKALNERGILVNNKIRLLLRDLGYSHIEGVNLDI